MESVTFEHNIYLSLLGGG